MDVQPIATKEGEAKIGQGVTRVIDGAIMMLTGTDEGGVQIGVRFFRGIYGRKHYVGTSGMPR